jgi:glycosyltransferase involved in cell wall biosynthesis
VAERLPSVVSVFGVNPQRIGGTETFARELSIQLSAAGRHSVLCFLGKPPKHVESFLELPNVSIEFLPNTVGFNFAAVRNLAGILRRYDCEVLHLHFLKFLSVYPWLARFQSVRKIYFTDHFSRPAGHRIERASLWKRLLARGINWPLSKAVCVSQYGYRCLTGLELLPMNRFELIYNGVDLTRVTPNPRLGSEFRQRFGISENRTIVLQMSWLIPEKGISELLQVARNVISKTENVQFVIVGEGAYRTQFVKQAHELGLGDSVTWTGMIQDPFGEGVLDAADIVCQLSQWEEIFGWMIAEAMAYGKPIIATRVGGIPELVHDSISGFLVERGDIDGTAETIIQLLANPVLRRQMGAVGAQMAREKFELRKNVEKLVELYEIR